MTKVRGKRLMVLEMSGRKKSLQSLQHLFHYSGHFLFCLLTNALNLLVSNLYYFSRYTQIGYYGDGKNRKTHLTGNDNLGDGRHTYSVAANDPKKLIFLWRFESRACGAHVTTNLHFNALFGSNLLSQCDKPMIVGLAHIGETRAKLIIIWSNQRIGIRLM